MLEISIFLFVLFLMNPIVSGIAAHTLGKSFWRWFLLGLFLPGVCFFALYWAASGEESQAG